MLSALQKKLIYMANHRGTKENDLLIGSFATNHLENLSASEQNLFENLLNERDDFLYKWIMGLSPSPEHYHSLCKKIYAFYLSSHQ